MPSSLVVVVLAFAVGCRYKDAEKATTSMYEKCDLLHIQHGHLPSITVSSLGTLWNILRNSRCLDANSPVYPFKCTTGASISICDGQTISIPGSFVKVSPPLKYTSVPLLVLDNALRPDLIHGIPHDDVEAGEPISLLAVVVLLAVIGVLEEDRAGISGDGCCGFDSTWGKVDDDNEDGSVVAGTEGGNEGAFSNMSEISLAVVVDVGIETVSFCDDDDESADNKGELDMTVVLVELSSKRISSKDRDISNGPGLLSSVVVDDDASF